jgi:hypothetical protein
MGSDRSYAQGTKVDAHGTQFDIMKALSRFGVAKHAFMSETCEDGSQRAAVAFEYAGLNYKISVLTPPPDHEAFTHSEGGRARTQIQATTAYESEIKRRWRSLYAVIKAKLIAVDDDVATFEQEFMAYILTGSGETLYESLEPELKKAAERSLPFNVKALPGGRQ